MSLKTLTFEASGTWPGQNRGEPGIYGHDRCVGKDHPRQEGLDLNDVTWVRSSDEHVEAYSPPQNVEMISEGRSLEEMLVSGELSAVAGMAPTEFNSENVTTLLPDPEESALRALDRVVSIRSTTSSS